MHLIRRIVIALLSTALLCFAAYGVGNAVADHHDDGASPAAGADGSERQGDESERGRRDADRRGADPAPESTPAPAPAPAPEPAPEPELQPGPRLLGPGDDNDQVKDLQARLDQIDWFAAAVTGFYGDVTTEAVRGFQGKREIPVTGEVDQRTLDRLHAMTRTPTQDELDNKVPDTGGNTPGALDPRCAQGRVLCVDKTSQTLRWVVDGQVHKTVDVRFGSELTPTREGTFSVESKSPDHVSSLYDTPMPFAMFFSGGQAVHYSADFASQGYAGASHGCVNVRDYDGIAWLYDQVQVGDTVIVYWS